MIAVALYAFLLGGCHSLSTVDGPLIGDSLAAASGDHAAWDTMIKVDWADPEWGLDSGEWVSMIAEVQSKQSKWDAMFGYVAQISIVTSKAPANIQSAYDKGSSTLIAKAWEYGWLAVDVAASAHEAWNDKTKRASFVGRFSKEAEIIDLVTTKPESSLEYGYIVADGALAVSKKLISWYCLQGMALPDLQKRDPVELLKWGLEFGARTMIPGLAVGEAAMAGIKGMASSYVAQKGIEQVVKKVEGAVNSRRDALCKLVAEEKTWDNLFTALEDDGIKETLKAGLQRLKKSDLSPPDELPPPMTEDEKGTFRKAFDLAPMYMDMGALALM